MQTKPQVIVTSFRRPKYLKQTLESLRQDDVQIYVADGGSDEDTRKYIKHHSDGCVFFEDNPGADFLKNIGITTFVTNPEFIICSDDLVFPKGYSEKIFSQYAKLNSEKHIWTFLSCCLPYIAAKPRKWVNINGVCLYEVQHSQVAGAVLDFESWEAVGGFPQLYGKSGQGDWAISVRLRKIGKRLAYLRSPMLTQIGSFKAIDYPEYTRDFEADEKENIAAAKTDARGGGGRVCR